MINPPDAARPQRQRQEHQRRSPSRRREEPSMSTTSASAAWIKPGLVALPLYGLILGFTTRKPQPDLPEPIRHLSPKPRRLDIDDQILSHGDLTISAERV